MIKEDLAMRKLFYVLTLVLLLAVVPVSTVEAKTTKPDKPTIEVKYSTSKDQWYARFNCKTKGATIKYKSYGKYKPIKSGKWFKIDKGDKYQAYSVKGKAKSKVCKYDTKKYAEAKRSADMHKVVDKWVDKNADDFTKLAGIVDFFAHSNYFTYNYDVCTTYADSLWYQKEGACGVLADQFKYICNQYGIKCSQVNDYKAMHAWNYVYIDDTKPIIIDIMRIVKTGSYLDCSDQPDLYTKHGKVTPSTRDQRESGLSVLNLAGVAKFEKNKITYTWDDGSGYYTIFTYSEKDGYWKQQDYDANGVMAKWCDECEYYTWCWYYGEEEG